jgi:hypothetical protein
MKPLLTGALALSLFVCPAALAFAGPQEEVASATSAWGSALGEDNPDKVLPLYSDDAVLWGTLSPTVRADRGALRDYFVTAFKVLPGLKVKFGEELIRVYGDTAVNTGYYTFSYVKDGETKCRRVTASRSLRMATIGSSSTTIPRQCLQRADWQFTTQTARVKLKHLYPSI